VAERTRDPRGLDFDLALERLAGTEQKMPAGDFAFDDWLIAFKSGLGQEDLPAFWRGLRF